MLGAMADDLKPAYLIAGTDRPKVDRAVARLRARFEADAVELLDAAETTGDDAVAACNALGLFGGGTRLVLVDGVEAWKAPDAKAVAEYLTAPAPGTTLALVGGELKKDAPIAKAVAAKGEVLLCDVARRPRGLGRRAVQAARDEGGAEACRLLIELVGDDLYELATEVDKLATWAGAEVTEAEVEELVAPRAQSPALRSPMRGATATSAGVLRATEHLLERTGDPRSRTIPRLAGTLTSHVGVPASPSARRKACPEGRDAAARLLHHFPARSCTRRRGTTAPRSSTTRCSARRARPRAEGRLAARGRARARARAHRDHAAA